MPKQTILKNFELVNLLTLQFNRMGLNRILNVRFLEEWAGIYRVLHRKTFGNALENKWNLPHSAIK